METGLKDFLKGIGEGDHETRHAEEMSRTKEMDVELSLDLSLGGRFGLQRKSGERLAGSSSAASVLKLAPTNTDTADHLNLLQGSGSQSHEEGTLTKTISLPARVSDAWRRRNAAQMRQRLQEIKKKNSPSVSKGAAGEIPGSSKSMETMATEDEMPGVSTTGLPRNVEGFLYDYRTVPVVIVCVCHGLFMSPEEFMKHAGAVNVQNPTHHIVMKSIV